VTAAAPRETVLETIAVTKTFGGTVALAGVDVRLEAGRVHAIIGENGAGKSTLMKILAGIEQPTAGSLRLDGADVRFADANAAAARGIAMIHQELRLFPDLTVAENLFVGRERLSRWGTVARREQERMARDVLARLGHGFISPTARVGTLPLGQQQIVEIARALVHDTRVLLMDEPTSALTSAEIPVLFDVIGDLARHGVAIVYISHRLEELLAIADLITVLRDGRVAGEAPAAAVDVGWIVERMTGRGAAELRAAPTTPRDDVVLEVRGLGLPATPGRTGLRDVSFDVRAGEVLGLYGLMGAGRTELLESLLGVHGDASGQVRLAGRDLRSCDLAERVAAGVAMVPEDRQAAGLVPTLSVRENITLSTVGRLAPHGYLSPWAEAEAAAPLVAQLRVKTPGLEAPVTALSGGNQQKVVLARGVMSRPAVLLLDEPTRGVDVGAKFEILEAMRRLAADGLAVLFATSDLVDVQAAATRVLVMADGRITADVPAESASAEVLASAASAMPPREGGPDARA
jgi:erythritol transport system ATP-binding protein